MADIAIQVILEMLFLILIKVEIIFANWEPNWKTYTLNKTLSITKEIQIINQKEFMAAA